MHQTFYIDIDEEITSVIDRLRKSRMKRLVFVIPQRALVLQSVVNLKLLKRQADRTKKQIMIVSQDEQTRTIAEKVGIAFQNSMQGITEETEYKAQTQPAGKTRTDIVAKGNIVNIVPKKDDRDIGSSGYYDSMSEKNAEEDATFSGYSEKILPSGNNISLSMDKVGSSQIPVKKPEIIMPPVPQKIVTPQSQMENRRLTNKMKPREEGGASYSWRDDEALPKQKEKFITSIYKNSNANIPSPPKKPEIEKPVQIPIGKGIKKTLVLFAIVALLIVSGVAAYLILPQAKVLVTLKDQSAAFSFEATGKADLAAINLNERLIPTQYLDQEIKKTTSFKATGSADGKDQKATGKVTIYNEFNTEPQSLVATTRLVTSDGKIFRLTKGVTVPGMAKVGSETKPGAVVADVMADQPGEEYNIAPTEFKIPGFEGGPKYDKFHAKSDTAMAGGGKSDSAVHNISKSDLASAKTKAEQELKDSKTEILSENIGKDELLVEEAVEIEAITVSCPPEGQVAENFECMAAANAKGFAVNYSDLEKMALQNVNQSGTNIAEFSSGDATYNIVGANADYVAQSVAIKVEGKAKTKDSIDESRLKNELLGLGKEDLQGILKKYPQIKEIEVDFWPNIFINKLPSDPKKFILNISK
jgi:hypothetical protein